MEFAQQSLVLDFSIVLFYVQHPMLQE